MAVPKKKTSPSRKGHRRGGKSHRLTISINLAYDNNGNPRLPHCSSTTTGEYKDGIFFKHIEPDTEQKD